MRGLEKNRMKRDRQTDRQTYGHRDSMIESAQWADSMKKDNIKKAKIDTAVLEQEDEEEQIKVLKKYTENVLESDLITLNQMKNLLKENTDEFRRAIDVGVKSLQNDLNQEKPSVEVTDDSY